MHAHALGRNIGDRVVQRGDVDRDDLAEVLDAFVEVDHVAEHREIRAIELENESGIDDRLVFALHHLGEREDIFLFGLVVGILEIARDLAGRGRGHEKFLGLGILHHGLGSLDVGERRVEVLPADRP